MPARRNHTAVERIDQPRPRHPNATKSLRFVAFLSRETLEFS